MVDELWLDHDLGGDDTIRPVLRLLEELAAKGRPVQVTKTFIITSKSSGGHAIRQVLVRLGLAYDRLYSLRGVLTARAWTPAAEATNG